MRKRNAEKPDTWNNLAEFVFFSLLLFVSFRSFSTLSPSTIVKSIYAQNNFVSIVCEFRVWWSGSALPLELLPSSLSKSSSSLWLCECDLFLSVCAASEREREAAHRIPYDKNRFHRCRRAFINKYTHVWKLLLLRICESARSLRMHLRFKQFQLIFISLRIPSHTFTDIRLHVYSFAANGTLHCSARFSFSVASRRLSLFRAHVRHWLRTQSDTHTRIANNTQARQPSDRATTDVVDTCTRAYINIFVDVSQKKCKIKKESLRANHIRSKWSSNKHFVDSFSIVWIIVKNIFCPRHSREYFVAVH